MVLFFFLSLFFNELHFFFIFNIPVLYPSPHFSLSHCFLLPFCSYKSMVYPTLLLFYIFSALIKCFSSSNTPFNCSNSALMCCFPRSHPLNLQQLLSFFFLPRYLTSSHSGSVSLSLLPTPAPPPTDRHTITYADTSNMHLFKGFLGRELQRKPE